MAEYEEDEAENVSEEEELEALAVADSTPLVAERQAIYNKTSLLQKLDDIRSMLSSTGEWIDNMVQDTVEPVVVENAEDDLKREIVFYQHALAGVKDARMKLDELGIAYRRPEDYFAECVKSDAHMTKVKTHLIMQKKQLENSLERKKQRDLAKFGKQVQVAKIQERAKQKKQTIEKIAKWRKNVGSNDEFPVELDNNGPDEDQSSKKRKRDSSDSKSSGKKQPNAKRQKKDKTFGYGGMKKHLKENTRESFEDAKFSIKKNKKLPGVVRSKGASGASPGKKNKGQRPGKARRQNMKSKGKRR
mmetsp:Transcript_21342/g.35293  ORF Transcript_21342/g.35293 Transcript_21342/m.35293 type:complete len:303 (+) Transcript_21342:21-929(+)|eukprot:CAMPEP_0184657322 /NCGR_PEP_ID=MMETSP0308-20130426/18968_1 /TAXON_ID=38269 /ORGANISM="Gloeochaete witrockiana, Strain SAG 46.84" /LENGTH=302 /DNA_ID=CAMNT_0027095041 /DNA_START=9 /DNA_END=917 /DNA_ORIENTATION=+